MGQSHKLWEANRLREREVQDKEDEAAATIRQLKKDHEKELIEREDSYLSELREFKKKSEQTLRVTEESYLKQLREAKKREQELIEKEDALLKEMNDGKMKDNFNEMHIDTIIRQKDEEFEKGLKKIIKEKEDEFEKEVAQLQDEVKRLRKEQQDANENNTLARKLEMQLLETKKEFDKQRRKYKAEMNKMSNAIELQKSKEGRLQSHIQSLEKQITDMVNDYETRLQDAFYDGM